MSMGPLSRSRPKVVLTKVWDAADEASKAELRNLMRDRGPVIFQSRMAAGFIDRRLGAVVWGEYQRDLRTYPLGDRIVLAIFPFLK